MLAKSYYYCNDVFINNKYLYTLNFESFHYSDKHAESSPQISENKSKINLFKDQNI